MIGFGSVVSSWSCRPNSRFFEFDSGLAAMLEFVELLFSLKGNKLFFPPLSPEDKTDVIKPRKILRVALQVIYQTCLFTSTSNAFNVWLHVSHVCFQSCKFVLLPLSFIGRFWRAPNHMWFQITMSTDDWFKLTNRLLCVCLLVMKLLREGGDFAVALETGTCFVMSTLSHRRVWHDVCKITLLRTWKCWLCTILSCILNATSFLSWFNSSEWFNFKNAFAICSII